MSTWSVYFKDAHLRRAQQRNHRRCPTHSRKRKVCAECLHIVCDTCGHKCVPIDPDYVPPPKVKRPRKPRKMRPVPVSTYVPPIKLRSIWEVVAPMGALSIEPHPDSGHWMIVFPKQHFGLHSAAELADRVWLDPKLRLISKPTSFTAGRSIKPERWWVSFQLKKG